MTKSNPQEKLNNTLSEDISYKLRGLLKEITHFTEEKHFGIYDFDKADWSNINMRELNYAWMCWYRNKYFDLKKWLDKFVPHNN